MNDGLRQLPTGIQTFEIIREGNYLYVDKTALVYQLAHDNRYVFMSRPRRFGKSLLCSTLKSYFEGRRDLFEGLAMERLETEWRKHPVLSFDFSVMKQGTVEDFKEQIDKQLTGLESLYGVEKKSDVPSIRLQYLVQDSARNLGQRAVVLIDEYDAPVLNIIHKPDEFSKLRTESRAFYAPLKMLDPYLRFVMLTGISKFAQLSVFSELNNLDIISMIPRYSTLCGITQQELETQLRPWVEQLADEQGLTVEEALLQLKQNYDGYHFAEDLTDVYNPYSLLKALEKRKLSAYWFETGTPTSLVNILQQYSPYIPNLDNGCEMDGNDFNAPTDKMVTPIPFLYQSGYLTIKDYDRELDRYILGYPNREVRNGMMQSLIPFYVGVNSEETKSVVADVYRAIRRDDLDEALQTLKAYLASIPYAENANSEGHYQTMLYVVFSLLGRYVQQEVRTAKGRIDMVLSTKTDLYVMELKIDRPAQEALDQIDQKGYLLPYTADGLHLHKVGIAFSTKERTLSEWMVVDVR